MNSCLLTLIATPEVEERLVDWLLDSGHDGVTTSTCQGHGVRTDQLSIAEQVVGRQRRVAFWIVMPEDVAMELVAKLEVTFSQAGLHHWLSPVLSSGPIPSSHAPSE